MSAAPRPAATVVLLRPAAGGFEVFLVQRNRRVGFMPSAWVFPGGRVDEGDGLGPVPAVRGGEAVARQLGLHRSEALPWLIAGVRETFEESGVWLGAPAPPPGLRSALCEGSLRFAELLAQGHRVDLDRLRAWSWWVTPAIEPRRYDTRFFVALAGDAEASHDSGETVASAWMRPSDAVEAAEAGRLPMAPPTWWTLKELAAHPSAQAVLQFAEQRPQRPVEPMVAQVEGGFELRLPGHPEHPLPAMPGLPTVVRFAQGRWWAEGGEVAGPPPLPRGG